MARKILIGLCMIILCSFMVSAAYWEKFPTADAYTYNASIYNPANAVDDDLTTWSYTMYGSPGDYNGSWAKPFENYTNEFKIEISAGLGVFNYTDSFCQVDPLRVMMRMRTAGKVKGFCYNGTDWELFYDPGSSTYKLYEFRIYRYNIAKQLENYNITDCTDSPNWGDVLLNFTIFDEKQPNSRLNSTFDATFNLTYGLSDVVQYSFNDSDKSSYLLCIDNNTGLNLSIDGDIRYKTDKGFTHRYLLNNARFWNKTTNISLYNFNTQANISELRIDVRNITNFLINPDIYVWLERYYTADDLYRLVQMDLSGDYGLVTFNIEERIVKYRLKFFDKSGHLLKQSNNLQFACDLGICEKTAIISDYDGDISATDLNIQHNIDAIRAGTTDILSINWSDSTGLTSNFRVEVKKVTSISDLVVCSQNISASSGQIFCNLENHSGTFAVRLFASASPEDPIILEWFKRASVDLSQLLQDKLGSSGEKEGLLIGSFIDLIMIGAGMLGGVIGVLIMLILSAIIKSWLGFMAIEGIIVTITIASMAIFAIFLLKRNV